MWRVGLVTSALLSAVDALIGSSPFFTVGFDLDDAFVLTDETLISLGVRVLPLLGLVIGLVSFAAMVGRRAGGPPVLREGRRRSHA